MELLSNQVTCSAEDGEVPITVVRKSGSAFPAEVNWSCADGDAEFGKHYSLNEGSWTNNKLFLQKQVIVLCFVKSLSFCNHKAL